MSTSVVLFQPLTMSAEAWERCMRTASGSDMLRAAIEEMQAQAARGDRLQAENEALADKLQAVGQMVVKLQRILDEHRAWLEERLYVVPLADLDRRMQEQGE